MIVRIQGEGQFELSDAARERLDQLDTRLFESIDGGDPKEFTSALADVVAYVEGSGTRVPNERLVTSDVILPASDTTLDEARALLTDEGYLKPVEA